METWEKFVKLSCRASEQVTLAFLHKKYKYDFCDGVPKAPLPLCSRVMVRRWIALFFWQV